jgi:type IV secretory pathway VirB10-like protein
MAFDRRLRSPARCTLALALGALSIAAEGQLYVCETPDGHKLSGSAPPPECRNLPIRVLNPDGSLKRIIEPPLTPEQRKAREQDEKKRDECIRQKQERAREDRKLLETYANEDDIEAARKFALGAQQRNIDRATQRLKETAADQEQQRRAIDNLRSEMKRTNEGFDAELQRYRELVMHRGTPVPCGE